MKLVEYTTLLTLVTNSYTHKIVIRYNINDTRTYEEAEIDE